MRHSHATLKKHLSTLLEMAAVKPTLSLKEILEVLSGKGRFLIITFLVLPFCQPIPLPGISTIFGLLIAFLGLRTAVNGGFWLPSKVLSKKISSKRIQKTVQKGLKITRKLQRFMRTRLEFLIEPLPMRIVNGLLIFVLGFLLALPIPIPFTNITAAWSILLLSLGLLGNDGLFIFLGYIASFITSVIFVFLWLSAQTLF